MKHSFKSQFLENRLKKDLVHMADNLGIRHSKSFNKEKLIDKLNKFSYRKLVISLNT